MNRDQLNTWITLLANLGVLGGLLFVGLEIRQNTAQLRSDASASFTAVVNQMNEGVYLDPSLAELLLRGEADFDDLDPVERQRFAAFQFARINIAEYVEDLAQEGVGDINFRYVDFLAAEYESKPGLRQFILSIENVWAGTPSLYDRLAGR